MPSTLQEDGRILIAELIKEQPLHIAWGTGDPAWDANPAAEPTNATSLLAEVGRRTVTSVEFVVPDVAGAITLPSGQKYKVSAVPAPWLYIRTVFDYDDATGHKIREFALCIRTRLKSGLPAGLRYFTPDQIDDRGRMYLINRDQRIERMGSTYQSIDFVLPI